MAVGAWFAPGHSRPGRWPQGTCGSRTTSFEGKIDIAEENLLEH